MSRIAQAFARAQAQNRAAFVAYLCAGDPDLDTSVAACRAVLHGGVDVLELGVPFSDPLADGLTNQLAAQRALEHGSTTTRVLELVRRIRAEFPETPIVFYTYYNLVFANGVDASIRDIKAAGVDGILTLDLPPEEAGPLAGDVLEDEDGGTGGAHGTVNAWCRRRDRRRACAALGRCGRVARDCRGSR